MLQEENTILCTKLYFPQVRFQLVSRPRLVEQIEQGLKRRLTLLSASAGYGKTTLLSEWRQTRPDEAVAWLSLDTGDNDAARFLAVLQHLSLTALDQHQSPSRVTHVQRLVVLVEYQDSVHHLSPVNYQEGP